MNRIHARDRDREKIRHWNLSSILFRKIKYKAFQSFPFFIFYFFLLRERKTKKNGNESSNIIVCLTPLIAILHSQYTLKVPYEDVCV